MATALLGRLQGKFFKARGVPAGCEHKFVHLRQEVRPTTAPEFSRTCEQTMVMGELFFCEKCLEYRRKEA